METTPDNQLSYLFFCSKALEGGYGTAIQAFGIILFVLIFNFLIRTALAKLKAYFLQSKNIWSLSFVSALYKPLNYFVWFVALVCTTDFLIGRLSDFRLINMHLILSLGGVLAFSWFLLRWNQKVVHYMLEMSQEHRIALSPGKLDMLSKLATIIIIFVTIFLIMDVTERDIQAIIAFGGIGGLALAFASQQVISNFFGGVMVYFTKPFTIGEFVNLPDKKIEGNIEEIGWYMTCIRSLDKKPIYIPNSIFTQTIMVNFSRMSHNRFFYSIGLRHSSLPVMNEVVNAIKVMLLKHPDVDHHLKVEVYFAGFEPTSLTLTISAYINLGGEDFNIIKQNILLKIGEIIESQGAEFAIVRYPIEMEITPRKLLTSELMPTLS